MGHWNEDASLSQAISGCLHLADRLELASIAFPAISTGIFGFPKERAARLILTEIQAYFTRNLTSGLKLVRLTIIDQPTIEAFQNAWRTVVGE